MDNIETIVQSEGFLTEVTCRPADNGHDFFLVVVVTGWHLKQTRAVCFVKSRIPATVFPNIGEYVTIRYSQKERSDGKPFNHLTMLPVVVENDSDA